MIDIAAALQCEPVAIEALRVGREAFFPSGDPTIRFERPAFRRLTNGRYDSKYPYLSHRNHDAFLNGDAEYEKFNKALRLDKTAALCATRWGAFQLSGADHVLAGFVNLRDFVNAMYRDEASQVEAFVAFVRNSPRLHGMLRSTPPQEN